MPEWMVNLTLGDMTATLLGLGVVAVAWKPVRKLLKNIDQISQDWNGTAERKDESGAVIAPARPGIPAQIETLRAQVQNSHKTNLREDLDAVHRSVKDVNKRLDEHITITEERRAKADELTRVVQEDIVPVAAKLAEQIDVNHA
ncbi:hypothetical protein ACIPY0_12185 [Paenarthrobacter nicotinovorans]|uniref:hypothetical protein n=1 Tax=Paenarthrobacter nicotinovorans TaxID=29320 RepID=UPI0038041E68